VDALSKVAREIRALRSNPKLLQITDAIGLYFQPHGTGAVRPLEQIAALRLNVPKLDAAVGNALQKIGSKDVLPAMALLLDCHDPEAQLRAAWFFAYFARFADRKCLRKIPQRRLGTMPNSGRRGGPGIRGASGFNFGDFQRVRGGCEKVGQNWGGAGARACGQTPPSGWLPPNRKSEMFYQMSPVPLSKKNAVPHKLYGWSRVRSVEPSEKGFGNCLNPSPVMILTLLYQD